MRTNQFESCHHDREFPFIEFQVVLFKNWWWAVPGQNKSQRQAHEKFSFLNMHLIRDWNHIVVSYWSSMLLVCKFYAQRSWQWEQNSSSFDNNWQFTQCTREWLVDFPYLAFKTQLPGRLFSLRFSSFLSFFFCVCVHYLFVCFLKWRRKVASLRNFPPGGQLVRSHPVTFQALQFWKSSCDPAKLHCVHKQSCERALRRITVSYASSLTQSSTCSSKYSQMLAPQGRAEKRAFSTFTLFCLKAEHLIVMWH